MYSLGIQFREQREVVFEPFSLSGRSWHGRRSWHGEKCCAIEELLWSCVGLEPTRGERMRIREFLGVVVISLRIRSRASHLHHRILPAQIHRKQQAKTSTALPLHHSFKNDPSPSPALHPERPPPDTPHDAGPTRNSLNSSIVNFSNGDQRSRIGNERTREGWIDYCVTLCRDRLGL